MATEKIIDVDVERIFEEMRQQLEAIVEPLRRQQQELSTRVNAMMLFLVRWTDSFGRLPAALDQFIPPQGQPMPDGAGPSQVQPSMPPPPPRPLRRSPPRE